MERVTSGWRSITFSGTGEKGWRAHRKLGQSAPCQGTRHCEILTPGIKWPAVISGGNQHAGGRIPEKRSVGPAALGQNPVVGGQADTGFKISEEHLFAVGGRFTAHEGQEAAAIGTVRFVPYWGQTGSIFRLSTQKGSRFSGVMVST